MGFWDCFFLIFEECIDNPLAGWGTGVCVIHSMQWYWDYFNCHQWSSKVLCSGVAMALVTIAIMIIIKMVELTGSF